MKNNNAKQVNNSDVHYSTEEVVIMNTTIMPKLLSAKEVADMLTIVGYSINATIVIFDRIRENLGTRTSEEALADWLRTSIGK